MSPKVSWPHISCNWKVASKAKSQKPRQVREAPMPLAIVLGSWTTGIITMGPWTKTNSDVETNARKLRVTMAGCRPMAIPASFVFASVGICRRTGFAETLRAQFAASNPDKADDESTAVLLMCSLPQTGPEVLDFAER